MDRRFIVVSGLAASGKSTLARHLGERLDLEVIDKDDDLEQLFDARDEPTEAATGDERRRLSRAADETFVRRARASGAAVLVSFWRRDELSATAGTPTDWLDDLGNLTEVFCRCDPDVALRRFVERARHPGHGDIGRVTDEAAGRFRELASFGALGLGTLIEVDTDRPVDLDTLCERLRS